MVTAIGVFAWRDHAEEAVRQLREHGVPHEAIVYLTRSSSEAENVSKEFGATVGGFVGGAAGMSAGVVAATLLLPGIGPVFALGFGAAALLGLAGAGAGAGLGSVASHDTHSPQPTPEDKCSEDTIFFREVLKEGRSLIVVRTESQRTASTACEILDRLGIGMQNKTPLKMQTRTREVGEAIVIDVSGRITLGEGNVMLRDVVRELLEKQNKQIILNLGEVSYIDSSGLGELVKTHTTIRNKGGRLKLVNLSNRMSDLLYTTRLSSIFDIHENETAAIASFVGTLVTQSVA